MKLSEHTAALFLQGDERATSEVYYALRELLYFIIASYLHNKKDIDDVYQEVFLEAFASRGEAKEPKKLQSYLCALAKNRAINAAKKLSHVEPLELEDELPAPEEPFALIAPSLTKKKRPSSSKPASSFPSVGMRSNRSGAFQKPLQNASIKPLFEN